MAVMRAVLFSLLIVLLCPACSTGEYAVTVRFASPGDRARAESVDVYLVPSCSDLGSTGEVPARFVTSTVVRAGSASTPLGRVPAGRVGLYARAHSADCTVFAAGCTEYDLAGGGSGTLAVTLMPVAGPACAAGEQCVRGECVATDGGIDAGVDADARSDVALDTGDAARCSGGTLCRGVCVDTDNDPRNCGACGNVCPVPANGGALCVTGTCSIECNIGYHPCRGQCVSDSSPSACGALCVTCPSVRNGSATCVAGMCGVRCNAGFHACDNTCVSDSDPATCGTACTPCPTIPHATTTCTMGTCGFRCDPGYVTLGTACEPRPRLLAPLPGAVVTRRRPVLRWTIEPGATLVEVVLCADRACNTAIETIASMGSSATPSTDLAPGVVYWKVRATTPSGEVHSEVWEFVVGARNAPLDGSWGALPDFNGDGRADAVVGAPGSNATYVYPGSASGPASASIGLGGAASSEFGSALASAGDVNGDGYVDLIVGAPAADSVYLFFGGPTGLVSTGAVVLRGRSGTRFGAALSGAGDTNGDGYADVIVGAPRRSAPTAIYFGGPTGPSSTPVELSPPSGAPSDFGTSVTGGCDFNGDGYADVAVGSADRQTVSVYFGTRSGPSTTPTVLTRPPGATGFGHSIACVGDVNGDGYADLVAASSDTQGGYLYFGTSGTLGAAPPAPIASNGSGLYLVAAGFDVNADGYADVLLGAPSNDAVHLFFGGATGLGPTSQQIVAPMGASTFGASIAGVGDVEGDGYGELIVGAPGSNAAFVYQGSAMGAGSTPTTIMAPAGAISFGRSVAQAERIPEFRARGRRGSRPTPRATLRSDTEVQSVRTPPLPLPPSSSGQPYMST